MNITFATDLIQSLSGKHLLKHEFYQDWSEGKLSIDELRLYAKQYYKHVDAFPRYISASHSNCEEINARQFLLENLIDEERGCENHPELWLRFAEGLGVTRDEVKSEPALEQTNDLVNTFMRLSRSSYAEGLGALFAYEHQVPDVAQSKIVGLEKFYGITSKRAQEFFQVHLKADVYHTNACAELLERLPEADKEKASAAAQEASQALWRFLDGVCVATEPQRAERGACPKERHAC